MKKIEQEVKIASVNGRDLSLSLKHAIALSDFIKGKDIDKALNELEQVSKLKKAIPMKGEIPHRKGMMSGRYPVNGSIIFIRLLKSLKSNAMAKDIELEKYKLHSVPNLAPRPYKRFGQGRFKRCHVTIKLIPRTKSKK
ncbi:MAG: uL22 family ribosomal protein [Candidatus Pacearchaeota archaeon]